MKAEKFEIRGIEIPPGKRVTLELPVSKFYTHAPVAIPVHIIQGSKPGPRLFVSAALHGDELNGVEIIRRLLNLPSLRNVRGTLIAIPVVNVHGLIHHSRYLPDRRDLNRCFPGSERGSLAARLANIFMTEIVEKCTHGIDLHTGSLHRSNLPQIRARLDDEETARLAQSFGVPVLLNTNSIDGSLRQSAVAKGVKMLLYEAGEALRFDEISIRAGVRGVIRVMRELKMLRASRKPTKRFEPVVARSSIWVRAPISGVFRPKLDLGARVTKNGVAGFIADPFGEREAEIISPADGVVIGRSNIPLANEGDALFHVACFGKVVEQVVEQVEEFQEVHQVAATFESEFHQ